MEKGIIIGAINSFKSFFVSKHLDRDGYNYIYMNLQNSLKGNLIPTTDLISFWYIVEFDIEVRQMLKDMYDTDIPLAPKEKMDSIIQKSKKAGRLIANVNMATWENESYISLIQSNLDNYVDILIECLDGQKPRIKLFEKYYMSLFKNYVRGVDSSEDEENVLDDVPYPLFKDVVGLEEAKKAVNEKVIQPSLHREIFEKYKIHVGGGMLLFGLPGTGKTMFAQAVANEINGAFFSIKASDIKSKWFGESEQHIKELFDEARKNDVSVIFFDEFEAIGRTRDNSNDTTSTTIVPELLSQMQGFEKSKNIILFIAATNRPWDIDPALLRPGRLDSLIYVDLPNYECRRLMLKNNLNRAKCEEDILEYLAQKTDGYNGSDIKKVGDQLLRIVIDHEIDGDIDYELQFEDCVEVLKKVRSSVSNSDIRNMKNFIENYCD